MLAAGLPSTVDNDSARREKWWPRLLSVVAAALAAARLYWYIAKPGVASYTVGGWLVFPGYCATVWWLHRRVPRRVQWPVATALAVGGVAAYLIWPNADWWYFGTLLAAPLAALIGFRAVETDQEPDVWAGGPQEGPWGPPGF